MYVHVHVGYICIYGHGLIIIYACVGLLVTGQNGIGQNGMEKMVRTKW